MQEILKLNSKLNAGLSKRVQGNGSITKSLNFKELNVTTQRNYSNSESALKDFANKHANGRKSNSSFVDIRHSERSKTVDDDASATQQVLDSIISQIQIKLVPRLAKRLKKSLSLVDVVNHVSSLSSPCVDNSLGSY